MVQRDGPEAQLLSVHPLPAGLDHAMTVLMWRKGTLSPKVRALRDVLTAHAVLPKQTCARESADGCDRDPTPFVPAKALRHAHKCEDGNALCCDRERGDCALSPCGRGQRPHVQELERVRGRGPYPSPLRACEATKQPSPARGEGFGLGTEGAEKSARASRKMCACLSAKAGTQFFATPARLMLGRLRGNERSVAAIPRDRNAR
jgi:hypothetical protein